MFSRPAVDGQREQAIFIETASSNNTVHCSKCTISVAHITRPVKRPALKTFNLTVHKFLTSVNLTINQRFKKSLLLGNVPSPV